MEGRLKPASPITQLCLQLRAMCDCVVRGCRRTDLTLLRWMGPPCHSLSTMGWIEHTTGDHLLQPPFRQVASTGWRCGARQAVGNEGGKG